jgi:cell division septation protein DedD
MRIGSFSRRALLCAAALGALGACNAEAPPYDELPLRDALSAAPDVIAALPEQARRDVAERLEEAHLASGEEAAIGEAGVPTVPALVRTADAEREEDEKDAIVIGSIEPRAGGFVLRGIGIGKPGEGAIELPALEGAPATSTAGLEEAALRGRAGAILGALGATMEVRELVRTTGVPAGVVAMDGTLYVNASWLVALSALEAPGDPQAIAAPPVTFAPPKTAQSVRVNPYKLPASINQCGRDVEGVCSCAAALQCDHERTDPTFANAQLECEWVNVASERADALCVLALMSIEAIRDCVRASGSECAQTVISTREEALAFVADEACVDVLNACLQFGRPAAPVSVPSTPSRNACNSGCEGCDCDGCNQNCDECNQNCSECNQSCKECNENCDQCNENCKECDENSKNCSGAGGSSAAFQGGASYCKVSRKAGRVPDGPLPFMAAFWMLAPAGYIARRIRRRA